MACGCNRRGNTGPSANRSTITPRQIRNNQVALSTINQPFNPSLSSNMNEDERRIAQLTREAIRRSLNR